MTASQPIDPRLEQLVRLADRWSDDSVASGWLCRRARELLGIELDTRTSFRLIRAWRTQPRGNR